MVNLMLNLFVNHIVENYPAIDYIAIEDVGFWLQQMVFHFSDTDEYYHLPITHDYKLILE